MIYAYTNGGKRVRPGQTQGSKFCPLCGAEVIPKQGAIVTDHFAHRQGDVCDDWAETMTEWHYKWQLHVEPRLREVCTQLTGPSHSTEQHFADMLTPTGYVMEVQHSTIGYEDLHIREAFYSLLHRGVIWLVDAREFWERINIYVPGYTKRELIGQLRYELKTTGETGAVNFEWSNPRKSWIHANEEVYFDPGRLTDEGRMFDGALFRVMNLEPGDEGRWDNYDPYSEQPQSPEGDPPGGYGAFVTKSTFCDRYKLRLPDKANREDPSAYPQVGPHMTKAKLDRSDKDIQKVPNAQLMLCP